jgi:uncharacterized protein YbaR (Trm112 family)
MKEKILHLLACPTCLPSEANLACQAHEKAGDDILTGSLICTKCSAHYRIIDGIAFLSPLKELKENSIDGRYESQSLLSSYIWSHFGDLIQEKDANASYVEWAGLLSPHSGFALDAGCAVGRFTHEMAAKFDFAIGVDNSKSFIKAAKNLMKNRGIDLVLNEEGLLVERKSLRLPATWDCSRMEFIVGDIQKLPFKKHTFSCASSLNLVDRIPMPLTHLEEINRVSKKNNAQFLFSDPFSWSTDIAKEENWLGGTTDGPFHGKGLDNVSSLLKGKGGKIRPSWDIKKSGSVWWKIRNHRNHFELIRSCYLKAVR